MAASQTWVVASPCSGLHFPGNPRPGIFSYAYLTSVYIIFFFEVFPQGFVTLLKLNICGLVFELRVPYILWVAVLPLSDMCFANILSHT
jgi:hypothetical protein